MKAFCIYFYQGNITFKNIINLVSFIINLVEYLVINSYSVTVLDNFGKETSDRAKKASFLEVFNSFTFILGNSPHLHGPPSWTKVWSRYHFDSLNYHIFFFFTTSLQVGELCSCFAAAWRSLLFNPVTYCYLLVSRRQPLWVRKVGIVIFTRVSYDNEPKSIYSPGDSVAKKWKVMFLKCMWWWKM